MDAGDALDLHTTVGVLHGEVDLPCCAVLRRPVNSLGGVLSRVGSGRLVTGHVPLVLKGHWRH